MDNVPIVVRVAKRAFYVFCSRTQCFCYCKMVLSMYARFHEMSEMVVIAREGVPEPNNRIHSCYGRTLRYGLVHLRHQTKKTVPSQ